MNVLSGGGCGQLRLPFLDSTQEHEPQRSYWQMLAHYFSPYFKFASVSFVFIIITFLCLLIPQFLFPASGYSKFLQFRLIPNTYLSPIQVKHVSHAYIYQTFTCMFFHTGWIHWLSNVFGIIINMVNM